MRSRPRDLKHPSPLQRQPGLLVEAEGYQPAPSLAGAYTNGHASAVTVSGNHLFVTDYLDLQIVSFQLVRDDIQLSASLSGTNLLLRWPVSSTGDNFVLQSAVTLPSAEWEEVSETPEVQGGVASLRLPLSGPSRFFRLVQSP